MKRIISKIFGFALTVIGSILIGYAICCFLGEIYGPSADRFGLVFVVGFGPIGSILFGTGIVLLLKQKTKKIIIGIIVAIIVAILFFFGITKIEEGRNIKVTALFQDYHV